MISINQLCKKNQNYLRTNFPQVIQDKLNLEDLSPDTKKTILENLEKFEKEYIKGLEASPKRLKKISSRLNVSFILLLLTSPVSAPILILAAPVAAITLPIFTLLGVTVGLLGLFIGAKWFLSRKIEKTTSEFDSANLNTHSILEELKKKMEELEKVTLSDLPRVSNNRESIGGFQETTLNQQAPILSSMRAPADSSNGSNSTEAQHRLQHIQNNLDDACELDQQAPKEKNSAASKVD